MTQTGEARGRVVAGRYRLGTVLGRGGMGTVWRAVDETLHRDVAVKELRLPDGLDDEERELQRERTLREARAAARVQHENVVTIHDVVEDDGIPWIVMELVEAESLAEILKARGTLTPADAAEVGLRVLLALTAAEAKGVLHRDVKPANILVTAGGRVVLTDFGIATVAGTATLTATGMLVGSPDFLAPERAEGRRPDLAADLWSLGLVLYMAVEGRNPFHRQSMIGTLNSILQDEPDPPRHAGPLLPVIEGWLRKDPALRTPAAEAEAMLRDIAAGRVPKAAAATPPPAAPGEETEISPGVLPPQAPSAATATTPAAAPPPAPASPATAASYQPPPSPPSRPPGPPGYAGPATAPGAYASVPPAPGPQPGPQPDHWPAPQYPATGAASVPPTGPGTLATGPYPPGGGAPERGGRTALVLGVVALVVAVVAASVVAVVALRANGDDRADGHPTPGPTGSGPASGSPAPTETGPGAMTPPSSGPTGQATPSAPPGYTRTTDPAGFQLTVPTGWQRRLSGEKKDQIDYVDPAGRVLLRIGTTPLSEGPLANFQSLDAKKDLPGYTRVQLAPYAGAAGMEAAVWEFTWTGDPFGKGARKAAHAIDLGIVAPDGRDFAIYVASFEENWAQARQVFDTVVSSFRLSDSPAGGRSRTVAPAPTGAR